MTAQRSYDLQTAAAFLHTTLYAHPDRESCFADSAEHIHAILDATACDGVRICELRNLAETLEKP
jgi:hypothetical protein